MAAPGLTYADLPSEVWGQEICRTLDDYARAALLCAGGDFRTLLIDIAPPAKKCRYCCCDRSNATLRNSVAAGHLACVRAQLPDNQECGWPRRLTSRAAKRGWIEVLRLLRSRGCPWSGGETQWAAAGGHTETLRVLRGELGCPWSGYETAMAAGYGRLETLRVLRQELGCEWSGSETSWAAAGGQTEILRVLRRELGCEWSGEEIYMASTCYGHAETLRVLREELNCPE